MDEDANELDDDDSEAGEIRALFAQGFAGFDTSGMPVFVPQDELPFAIEDMDLPGVLRALEPEPGIVNMAEVVGKKWDTDATDTEEEEELDESSDDVEEPESVRRKRSARVRKREREKERDRKRKRAEDDDETAMLSAALEMSALDTPRGSRGGSPVVKGKKRTPRRRDSTASEDEKRPVLKLAIKNDKLVTQDDDETDVSGDEKIKPLLRLKPEHQRIPKLPTLSSPLPLKGVFAPNPVLSAEDQGSEVPPEALPPTFASVAARKTPSKAAIPAGFAPPAAFTPGVVPARVKTPAQRSPARAGTPVSAGSGEGDESRRYICEQPGCEKRYKNPGGLKYHMQVGQKMGSKGKSDRC